MRAITASRPSVSGVAALFALILSACGGGSEGPGTEGTADAAPGVVRGRVTKSDDAPLQGATIAVAGTEFISEVVAMSGSDGSYSTRLGNLDANHKIAAWYELTYEGHRWKFPLEPVGGPVNSFLGRDGLQKDFVWKITGTGWWGGPPGDLRSFIGASMPVEGYDPSKDPGATDPLQAPVGSVVEVTFTPQGAAIDGSSPGTMTREVRVESEIKRYSGKVGQITDLPVARYLVTAKLRAPDGTTRDLFVGVSCSASDACTRSGQVTLAMQSLLVFYPDEGTVHGRPYQHPPAASFKLYVHDG